MSHVFGYGKSQSFFILGIAAVVSRLPLAAKGLSASIASGDIFYLLACAQRIGLGYLTG